VVIPTRDRWPILEGTLEALAQQATGEATFEVVAVDNGSSDGTREELERLAALGGYPPLVAVVEPLGGAGAARNAGVRAARGELLRRPLPGLRIRGLRARTAPGGPRPALGLPPRPRRPPRPPLRPAPVARPHGARGAQRPPAESRPGRPRAAARPAARRAEGIRRAGSRAGVQARPPAARAAGRAPRPLVPGGAL